MIITNPGHPHTICQTTLKLILNFLITTKPIKNQITIIKYLYILIYIRENVRIDVDWSSHPIHV